MQSCHMVVFREPFVDKEQVISETFALMCEEGIRRYPNEACGLIVQIGKKSVAMPCPNTSPEPRNRFRIAAIDYAECSKQGKVIGVWHTHTDESPEPSEADRSMCEGSGVPWYIVGVCKRDDEFDISGPVCIDPSGYQTPYVGRPYVFGIHDCHTLLCDFYAREYGIEIIRERPRIEEWWRKGYNFFAEGFEEDGFVSLIDQEPQVGDVFLLQIGSKVASHIAIYLGDDQILHHCYGRLSTRDVYGGYWAKHTVYHLRHKSKC